MDNVQKCCRSSEEKSEIRKEDAAVLFRNIIVDRQNKFLYCYSPKVASTNIKRLLLAVQGKVKGPDAVTKFNRRVFDFLGDFSSEERKEMLKSYFKFMFVRHPFARLVSAYRHRILSNRTDLQMRYGRKIVRKYRWNQKNTITTGDVKFREFVRYLIDTPTESMNLHWKPIFESCFPCMIQYDFIGSMEHLERDVAALLKALKVPKKISLPKLQSNYHPLTTDQMLQYYSNITYKELSKIRHIYSSDLKCFVYNRYHTIRGLQQS